MSREIKTDDTTKIVYDHDTERFTCTKCGHIFDYQFDFKFCPYCRRKIIKTEKRF